MSDLVQYWRSEAQHLDVARGIDDQISVEYMAKAKETADEIERLRKIEKAAIRVSEAQLMSSEQFNALEELDDALGINSPQPAA